MKIGVKIYKEEKILDYFKDKADFFEVMALEGNDYNFLKKYSNPLVFHAQHLLFGINNADRTKQSKNLESINFVINLADLYGGQKIILHAGKIIDENCSKEQAVSFAKQINDKRVLIENVPYLNKGDYFGVCSTPENTKEFLELTGKKFCFDINHAVSTAIYLKQNYLEMIKDFIKLKPAHYHLGGQVIERKNNQLIDTCHLCLKNSNINLNEILELMPKNAEITLETEPDINKTKEDIRIIRKIIKDI